MSSSTTTPVILPEDIKFYLSGGYFNNDPVLSLGGEISSFQLVSGTLNGLFDRVDTAEAELGDMEYRCIYLRNTSQTRKLLGAKIWIETGTASPDTSIAISIGSSGINGTEPRIPDEGIEPPMNFFAIPLQAPDEPNLGDLYPGDHVALWIRWYVNTGTQSIADDFAVIRIDGEREAESLSQPLPNPSDPPPSTEGCPQGSKWSPVEMRCVDDATVIRCPNGYTYDSTTQRCVPPSTPPPSIPNWTFAAAGDFSCSGDADDTGALIGSKLNKTAGNDIGLLLALGDFSYEDGDESCWYDNMESNLGPTIYPDHVAPILGNHDDSEDGSSSDRTSVIAEFPLMPTQAYYAFTRRNIRFIMMDTQSSYGTSSQQFAFVKSELEKATADPSIMWKVVCYHKPSVTTASYYGPLTDFRTAYHALFSQHKVSIVFNGHNHIYFRSKPLRFDAANPGTPIIASDLATGNYINVDGTIYCTAGAAGRSSHTEYDSTAENFVGFRHAPAPYGAVFVTLQDSGNQLRFQFITNANQILDDFTLSKPGATPPPTAEKVCPTGFNWSETLGRCVISPTQCPTNYRWEPAQNRCVAISGNPPPTGGDPLVGVTWYYDSTATQNSAQTITASSYDATEGIILSSNISSVANTVISGGYINVKAGTGGTGRIYFDYWKKSRWSQDELPKFNIGMLLSFVYEGQTSVTIRDGNSPTTGFSVPGKTLQFEGFGFTLTSNQIIADVNYYSTTLGETVSSVYPGSRTLVNGRTYKIFYTIRKDRVNNRIVLNVWMDFGDGTNTWLKIMTDRTWSSSNWNPGDAPTSTDETQIETGPYAIERHHVMVRNNGIGSADLKVKDVKIGVTGYVGDINNPPPTGGGNPGGGGGTGGTLDSRGIRWYAATGQQGVIAQTRNEADDDRWSGNITNVDQYGYEVTMIMQNFSGVASDGHFALKHWGPNHSAPCGYEEDGDCCCWYDTGIRSNGDVQLQTERPHPSNHDFSLTFNATNGPLFMRNIGKSMNGNSIGLKWLVHPVTPGGDSDNGGIHLMMWADIDPIGSDGKPKNGWKLVYDFVDTGQILGDYNPPSEHDCEVRNSGTNSRTPYGGGLHWRKLQGGDTLQWNPNGGTGGTGGGTGGGTTDAIAYIYSSKFGSQGNGNGQFQKAEGIAIDSSGNVYISDWVRQDIQKFTSTGQFITKFGTTGQTGSAPGQFDTPFSLRIDPRDGHLWVADQFNNRLQKINKDTGAFMQQIGPNITGLTSPTGLNNPEDLAFDPVDFSMYINDSGNRRIVKINSSGNYVRKWPSYDLHFVEGIAVHPQTRNIYTTDYEEVGIWVYSPDGVELFHFGTEGEGPGQLTNILERQTFDQAGRFYQIDSNTSPKVVIFDKDGRFISEFGSPGSGDGQFDDAEQIAVNTSYKAYVVDQANYRIQIFNGTLGGGTGGTGGGGGGGTTTTFKLISWGDNDTTQDAEDVLNQIMTESNVEQYLFAGDGPYSENATEWINMMSSYFNTNVLKGKLMLAQGNHEHPESESQTAENQIEAWFPGLNNADDNLDWLQAKIVRNCYIIIMNSQDPQIATVGGDQYNWVQARLNEAVALRTSGTIDWIITVVHKNWFSVNAFTTDGFDARYAYKTMFNNAQVDFMFSGHTHTYQIFKPIVPRVSESDETDNGTLLSGTFSGSYWNFALTHGVIQIINGNGGHEINGFAGDPDSISTVLYANDTEFGYTVLEINGKIARVIAKSVGGNVRHTVTVYR